MPGDLIGRRIERHHAQRQEQDLDCLDLGQGPHEAEKGDRTCADKEHENAGKAADERQGLRAHRPAAEERVRREDREKDESGVQGRRARPGEGHREGDAGRREQPGRAHETGQPRSGRTTPGRIAGYERGPLLLEMLLRRRERLGQGRREVLGVVNLLHTWSRPCSGRRWCISLAAKERETSSVFGTASVGRTTLDYGVLMKP